MPQARASTEMPVAAVAQAQPELMIVTDVKEPPKRKRGFWSRIFGREDKSGNNDKQQKQQIRR
jgi:hypothetical protein